MEAQEGIFFLIHTQHAPRPCSLCLPLQQVGKALVHTSTAVMLQLLYYEGQPTNSLNRLAHTIAEQTTQHLESADQNVKHVTQTRAAGPHMHEGHMAHQSRHRSAAKGHR